MKKSTVTTTRTMTLAIVAALGFGAAAHADNLPYGASAAPAPSQYVVRFADLDVSKIEGATVLYARLRHAAGVVCQPLESREMALAQKYRVCMDKAVADAVAGVDRPLLTQYHQLRTKGEAAGYVQVAKTN